MTNSQKPVVLVVLDGWGNSSQPQGNAILNARIPTFLELDKFYPKTFLQASGISVGLPWMQYGNSEVGHQALGTGQVVFQDLPRISNSIKNGEFFKNPNVIESMKKVKKNKTKFHLMGLASNGGVHSHIDHLLAFLEMAKSNGISSQTFIHAFTDGRDTSPSKAPEFVKKIIDTKTGQIATLGGRYYGMDRNKNWDRIKKSFDAMVLGEGIKEKNPIEAIKNQYDRNKTDEHLEPVVIVDSKGEAVGKIEQGDTLLFFNFRKDRAKQIAGVFCDPKFNEFQPKAPQVEFISMVSYDDDFESKVAFPPQKISSRVSEIISSNGLKQLKIAETEKYAHVTYFFNGGEEKPYQNEDQILVPSKNAPSYADVPEMSAKEITRKLLPEIDKQIYDFILINYANPDMVGHTGEYNAGIKAVETVSEHLKELIIKVLENDGSLLITADHGNVEEMVNLKTGEKDTQHSNNPVPCWLVTPNNRRSNPIDNSGNIGIQGMLVDVAPTILSLLGISYPGLVGMDLRKIMK
ncbi:MAG: 2,3-bisphosphoglycerate-independent phosphoglycerate mutase [Candidatus Moranbacteria bacterium]|nr:2,3-bisphosphoglycerate-independent phosphoglycerate mutase [Candidatus Moranbacteria bacterium]